MSLFCYMNSNLKMDSCDSSSIVFLLHDAQEILPPLLRLGFALSDVNSVIMELCQVLMHQEQIHSDSSGLTTPAVAAC